VWRSRNVLALGLLSLLTDSASEMVMPLLPAFLAQLGGGALALGWIEGLAEAVASVLKLVSGRVADRTGKRRPLVVAGYTLASVARPLVAVATSVWHVLAVRLVDRTGKGLRTSPRDALLAASVPPAQHGRAFGFHRAMDHAGAVAGPLLAFAVLALGDQSLRLVFALAAIPSALAVLVAVAGVREVEVPPKSPVSAPSDGVGLVRVLAPFALFSLGKASDVFLLLAAGAVDSPLESLPLLWVGLHVVKSAVSVLGGSLADRWGRGRTMILGWSVHVAAYIGFSFAESRTAVWALFVAYGVHHGLSEGAEKALVAELAPAATRGSAFGWYHLIQGLLALAASVLFGWIWEAVSRERAFQWGAAIGLLGVLCYVISTSSALRGGKSTKALP
jgi:MFS family permease